MNNNINNNINFQGGFLLKKPSTKMWGKIYNETVPNNRVIIHDLFEKDNIFFASKTYYDSSILTYLLSKKNLKFTYYPEINLKSGLNGYYPEEAEKILNSSTAIETRKEMKKFIKPGINPNDTSLRYKWKVEDHIPQTFKALKLNSEDYKVKTKDFITAIYDKNGKIIAKVSPNNQVGINYAYIYPRYSDESFSMIAINHKGEIISRSNDINSMKEFRKHFTNAVKIDAGRKRPQNT